MPALPVSFGGSGHAFEERPEVVRALAHRQARARHPVGESPRARHGDAFVVPQPNRTVDGRQRAALGAAAVGYYEVPRTGASRRVTAELDCAPSTAGELLRKAESALVAEYTAERPTGDSPFRR